MTIEIQHKLPITETVLSDTFSENLLIRGCTPFINRTLIAPNIRLLYRGFTQRLIDVIRHIIKDNDIDLEIDLGASTDLARRVRLPFTYNQSTGTQAVLERGSDYRYTREDIDEWLSENPIEKIKEERTAKSRKSEKNYGYNMLSTAGLNLMNIFLPMNSVKH